MSRQRCCSSTGSIGRRTCPFLLEQLARLHTTAANDWPLALAGDGEERLYLKECVRRLGLTDITTWHGWQQDKARLLDLYQQADVVVNPSLYEGMPNVVLEAMACGLPVVASAVRGNDSLVRSGDTGFLFPLADGDALCAALQEIRDKPELAAPSGRTGGTALRKIFPRSMWHAAISICSAPNFDSIH